MCRTYNVSQSERMVPPPAVAQNYTYAATVNYDEAPTWFHGKLIRRLVDHQLWHTRVFFHGSDHGRVCHLIENGSVRCSCISFAPKKDCIRRAPPVCVCVCVWPWPRLLYLHLHVNDCWHFHTSPYIRVNEKNYLSFVIFYRVWFSFSKSIVESTFIHV